MNFDSSVEKEIVKIVRTKKEPSSEKEITEKQMISELKKIMKENDKLENLIEKGRDKNTAEKNKLITLRDALKNRKKQLKKQLETKDANLTMVKKIEQFKKLRGEMNVDKIDDKIAKLTSEKEKYKSQLKKL